MDKDWCFHEDNTVGYYEPKGKNPHETYLIKKDKNSKEDKWFIIVMADSNQIFMQLASNKDDAMRQIQLIYNENYGK